MKELRCTKCNKLLARYDGNVEVKCPRCKDMNSNKKFVPRNIVKECLDRVTNKKCFHFATIECIYNCEECKHNQ